MEADEKSDEDMISEVWLQNGLEMPYYQRYILEFERIINTMTTPTIDDKLKRNLGLYGIVASNGLFNGDNLNEDDFNTFADNMPYFEGLGYYIDISDINDKLRESYKGQAVMRNADSRYIIKSSSIKKFNGANIFEILSFGICETLGYSINIEGSVQIEPNDYLVSVDRLENEPKVIEAPEGNYYKSLQNKKLKRQPVIPYNEGIRDRSGIGGACVDVVTSLFDFTIGAARAYRLGDYAVETWQDQFDSGNNYFTIQAYCVDSYDPVKNTTNYRYKYLSQNDRKFKDKVKSAKKKYEKGVDYVY